VRGEARVERLLPKSSNKRHTSITPDEGDSVQGVVQEILNIQDNELDRYIGQTYTVDNLSQALV